MKVELSTFGKGCLQLPCIAFMFLFLPVATAQTNQPVVVSARIESGIVVYRVNGRKVEDAPKNSLLTNLENVLESRKKEVPVFLIIDVRAPFTEVGKLTTALDKIGWNHYRLFVSDFRDGIMNEIHWDKAPIPIPNLHQ